MLIAERREERVDSTKAIASRIAKQAEGLSIREFLDASALAAGTMIRILYRGPGVSVAVERYIEALRRAVNKGR